MVFLATGYASDFSPQDCNALHHRFLSRGSRIFSERLCIPPQSSIRGKNHHQFVVVHFLVLNDKIVSSNFFKRVAGREKLLFGEAFIDLFQVLVQLEYRVKSKSGSKYSNYHICNPVFVMSFEQILFNVFFFQFIFLKPGFFLHRQPVLPTDNR